MTALDATATRRPGRSPYRLVAALLLIVIAGCGGDRRQVDICRRALSVLAEDSQKTDVTGAGGSTVAIGYRDATMTAHRLQCRFEDTPNQDGMPAPREFAIDGRPLTPVHFALLVRWLGLELPESLLTADQPVTRAGFSAAYLMQALLNGLCGGAVLALIAVGYSLVYAVSRTIQFAFGEIFMTGAYLMIILTVTLTGISAALGGASALTLIPILAGTVAVAAALGWTMERVVYRPVRRTGSPLSMVGAIGLSVFLQNAVQLVQGSDNKWIGPVTEGAVVFYQGGDFTVSLSRARVLALLFILVTVLIARRIARSPFGRSWRACAEDQRTAALLGVDVDRIITVSFVLGAILAAVAGLLTVLQFGEADFTMGLLIGFKALTAAVIGGIGSLPGAVAGGVLVGLTQALWAAYFDHAYQDVAVFVLLCAVALGRRSQTQPP
ncbi:MAG: branched-chain amino acid ABC transporter permease [Azospirillaceae bacterium]|nr:branched-chain amino acid ABC transporter permease [Azospirillaceae bacterium]